MPPRKYRSTTRPKRMLKRAYKSAFRRRFIVGMRTLSETLYAGTIYNSTPTGGSANGQTWWTRFSDIPQNIEYSKLYRQFCIRKLQLILLPRFTVPDANNFQGFVGSGGYGAMRLAYAIDESPALSVPTSELDVLQSNGSKIVMCNGKKIVINCKNPRPDMLSPNAQNPSVYTATRTRGITWLNTQNGDVAYDGTSVRHGSVRTFCTMNFVGPVTEETSIPVFDVYYKVTFSLRDPA